MKRESLIPRPDWPAQMEALGFTYHSIDGVYWDERACYRFSSEEINMLEAATQELHEMCLDVVGEVVTRGDYGCFAITDAHAAMVEHSWNEDEATLFGRFDLAWDGSAPPKLLEYNADTPTALLEASVAQWYWLEAVKPGTDQFNSLHEKLIARWREIAVGLPSSTVHFACAADSEEDVGNLDYLRDVATQAGIEAPFVGISDIGWDAVGRRFVDLEDREIQTLFKLYPWEWMTREAFGLNLAGTRTRFIEPAWKMLLSNKAILPLLWQKYPGHPNLLAAYFELQRFATDFVKKPLLSREGANIAISSAEGLYESGGEYGNEGYVYQAYHPLPNFRANGEDNHMVIGSWIVGGEAAGIGIREDATPITRDTSRFVPHYFA